MAPKAPAGAAPVAPAPLKMDPKKETAKVPVNLPPNKPLPQATVQMTKPAPAASTAPASAIRVAPQTNTTQASGGTNPILAIAALVTALAAFGIQVWMMLAA